MKINRKSIKKKRKEREDNAIIKRRETGRRKFSAESSKESLESAKFS